MRSKVSTSSRRTGRDCNTYRVACTACGHADRKKKREKTMSMFRDGLLKGKRILVTGGGTGLGEVMAEAYAGLSATVYICGRRASVLDETAKRISDATHSQVKGIACDIRVAEAVDDMIAQIW